MFVGVNIRQLKTIFVLRNCMWKNVDKCVNFHQNIAHENAFSEANNGFGRQFSKFA